MLRPVVWLFLSCGSALLVVLPAIQAAEGIKKEWQVEGVKREAILFPPSVASDAPPVVFAFHGHGGTMQHAARTFRYQTLWPEAVVVYMQGLNTPGRLTDPEGKKPGWQAAAGDQGDRDLKFFDAVFASLQADYKIDPKRVYATGHSNGGGFTYLLWATRGEKFAAFAPSAAVGIRQLAALKPKPLLHVAGESDPLVKFSWQEKMIEAVCKLNRCGEETKPWRGEKFCQQHGSAETPVVTCIHPGDHKFPDFAPKLIVMFFQEHRLP